MRIENFRESNNSDKPRVSAMVSWEDCDRKPLEIFFETAPEFAEGLWSNPHAFLLGSILPAMRHGEKRVLVDAKICPELRENLDSAINWIHCWNYKEENQLVKIEARTQSTIPIPNTTKRAGVFVSGGIDSLAALLINRANFPLSHPLSYKEGLIIYGQNVESDNRIETFQKAIAQLSEVTQDLSISLIPVYTNIRDLDLDTKFFMHQSHGAILASVAHAFSARLNVVSIASSEDIPSIRLLNRENFINPSGSHPLLDANYGSADLRIRHVDITTTRYEKVKLVAGWNQALQNIKVCAPNYPGDNCGMCEKCIRTQLALVALNVLDKTRAFPLDDLSENHVKKISINHDVIQNYLEMIPHLAKVERHDLVRSIKALIKRSVIDNRRENSIRRTKIKEFDKKYFNGALQKIKRSLYS